MRLIRRLIRFLGLGLVTALMGAWGCALWAPNQPTGQWFSDGAPPPALPVPIPVAWLERQSPQSRVWMEYVESRGTGLVFGEFGFVESNNRPPTLPFSHTLTYWRGGWPMGAVECIVMADTTIPAVAIWPGGIEAPARLTP